MASFYSDDNQSGLAACVAVRVAVCVAACVAV